MDLHFLEKQLKSLFSTLEFLLTSEKIRNSTFQVKMSVEKVIFSNEMEKKPKYYTYFSIEFGKVHMAFVRNRTRMRFSYSNYPSSRIYVQLALTLCDFDFFWNLAQCEIRTMWKKSELLLELVWNLYLAIIGLKSM